MFSNNTNHDDHMKIIIKTYSLIMNFIIKDQKIEYIKIKI